MRKTGLHRRRASAYVALLGISMIVAVIGLSALTAIRIRQRTCEAGIDFDQTRFQARSAVEVVLHYIEATANWRSAISSGYSITGSPLGTGTFSLVATDPIDGTFADSVFDPVLLRIYGYEGPARCIAEATLDSDALGLDPLADKIRSLRPLVYWRFGEASGLVASDDNGRHPGQYVNGVTLGEPVSQRENTAARFDGSNDFVEIPHSSAFLLDNGTVQFWFRPDSTSNDPGLWSKDSSGYDTGGHLTIWADGSVLWVRLQSRYASYYATASGVTSGAWNHAAFRFGSSGMQVFLNGAAGTWQSYTGGLGTSSGGAGNYEPIAIAVDLSFSGDRTTSGWSYPFDGLIDEVAMFSRQLTNEEILALYQAGTATPPYTLSVRPGSWRRIVE